MINIYDVNRNLSMLMYFLIFIYIIAEFGADIKCAVVGNSVKAVLFLRIKTRTKSKEKCDL